MENEYENMLKIIENTPKGTTLLLHSCCAPCSSRCLEILHEHFSVTVLYYNPNIDDEQEYQKRKEEQIRFLKETGWADFLDCDYDQASFEAIAKGREQDVERGQRCYYCYSLRLKKTAEMAKEKGFAYFGTTLTVSPYKVSKWLNEIGRNLEKEVGVLFLPSDFKKEGGYLRSIELSKKYNLYRQNFCGCRFSKRQAEEKIKTNEENKRN